MSTPCEGVPYQCPRLRDGAQEGYGEADPETRFQRRKFPSKETLRERKSAALFRTHNLYLAGVEGVAYRQAHCC